MALQVELPTDLKSPSYENFYQPFPPEPPDLFQAASGNKNRAEVTMAPENTAANRAKNLERRHMVSNHGRTTIALEPEFWIATDKQAKAKGMNWRQWVIDQLDGRPDSYGRASWLRVAILKAETLR